VTEIMIGSANPSWRIYRLGQLFRERREKVNDRDFPPLSVTKNGIVPQLETAAKSDDTDNRKGVRAGDFVINSRSDRKGSGGLSELDGSVSLISIVLEPLGIDRKFAHHLLRSSAFQEEFYRWGHGIVADLWTTRYSDMKNIRLAVSDVETQKAIADFLDRETARIDQLIEKKQRLVGLLGEKLDDDILRAVTLGIDPDVEMVPEDELEWTTHRPKHWKLYRLKHFFRENTQYSKDGQETLFSLRMKEGLVPHNDVSDKEIPPSDLINFKKVFPGQIVMNRMRAAIGLFGLADCEGIVSPDYSTFDVSPKAHAAYFLRLFKSEPMMAAFRLLSKGLGTGHSGFMRLNADNFGRIRVAVPEREEQRLVSNHVENRIAQITKLQVWNEQSINRLREFRSALITAAVTGQMDVATWGKQGQTDRRLDQIEEDMSVREARA